MVSRGEGAQELRRLLRRELVVRLGPAGWRQLDERAAGPFALAAFVRPVDGEFAATAEVGVAGSVADSPPVEIRGVMLGVSYEPLRRLWPLLDMFGVAVIAEEPEDDDELGLEVGGAVEVPRVAETLATLILDRAVPLAEEYASIETLLDASRDLEDPEWTPIRLPALLAAAGRFDEARDALARWRPAPRPGGLDAGATAPPAAAVDRQRWRRVADPARSATAAVSHLDVPTFRRAWRDVRLRDEAVAEVRRAGRGRDRAALPAMLEVELGRRGVEESSLWIEQTLDHLWDSAADRARLGLHGLRQAGRLGAGIVRAIRAREIPEVSQPRWLDPPERAAYALPGAGRWVAVELDPDAAGGLERAHGATPRLGATTVELRAWLDRGAGSPSHLVVHLGERRVGVLAGDASDPVAHRVRANVSHRPGLSGRPAMLFAPARSNPTLPPGPSGPLNAGPPGPRSVRPRWSVRRCDGSRRIPHSCRDRCLAGALDVLFWKPTTASAITRRPGSTCLALAGRRSAASTRTATAPNGRGAGCGQTGSRNPLGLHARASAIAGLRPG